MVIPSAIPKNIVIEWDKIANDLKDLFFFKFFMVKPFFKIIKFYELLPSLYSFIIDAINHNTMKNDTEYSLSIGIT